jgi:hypothetical protein
MSRNVEEQKPTTMATFPNRKRTRSQPQWQHVQTGKGANPTTMATSPDK